MRDRTLEDWLDALRVKTAKAKSGIPCPLCGGDDRFHVQRGTRGQGRHRRVSAMLEATLPRLCPAPSLETPSTTPRRPVSRPPSLPRTTKVARPSGLARRPTRLCAPMLGIRRLDAELSESPCPPLVVESSRPRCERAVVVVG